MNRFIITNTVASKNLCVLLLLTILAAGCQSGTPAGGQTRYQVLDPAPAAGSSPSGKHAVELEPLIDYVPGHIRMPFAEPAYPADALAAHAGKYEVTVAITIDETGHVSDVVRSLRGPNLPSPYADSFFEAVKAAVFTWKFDPSHQVYYQRAANGERNYVRTESVSQTVDIKFTFDPSGKFR